MRNCNRARTSFRQCRFGRIIRRIKVDVRHFTNKAIRPVLRTHTGLFARHKFKRAVHPKVQKRVGVVGITQPQIELRKRMGWGKTCFKQQAHRVALVPKRRLHADKYVAEMRAKNEHAASVGLDLTWCWAPYRFDLVEVRRMRHDIIGRNVGGDIGFLAILLRVPFQDNRAQRIHVVRYINFVPFAFHAGEGVKQALENAQIRSRSNSAGIGRKTEQHDADFLFQILFAAQIGHAQGLFGKVFDTFKTRRHRLLI